MFFNRIYLFYLVINLTLIAVCFGSEISFSIDKKKEFVESYGYPYEIHKVVTPDGYILEIDRIPYGKNSSFQSNETRPVVLVMPGLWCDSNIYISAGPERGLAFLLADRGYDVWLGNNRGTTPARAHTTLDPDKDSKFWNFSFYELAVYDLKSQIDYVLNYTAQSNLTYIGHSQGATVFFVLLSELPEYHYKIKIGAVMAPAVYFSGATTILTGLVRYRNIIHLLATLFRDTEVMSYSPSLNNLMSFICGHDNINYGMCLNLLSFVSGPTNHTYNIGYVFKHCPAGSSVKQLWHFCQIYLNDQFRQYDYGASGNMEKYGQITAPTFELKNVIAPIILYYGNNDALMSYQDIFRLASSIREPLAVHKVVDFGHYDFIWREDAVSRVYVPLMNSIQEYV